MTSSDRKHPGTLSAGGRDFSATVSGEDLGHGLAGLVPAAERRDVHAHDLLEREHELGHLTRARQANVAVALDLASGMAHQHDVIVPHVVVVRILALLADA